jgi:hypothetical protein
MYSLTGLYKLYFYAERNYTVQDCDARVDATEYYGQVQKYFIVTNTIFINANTCK